MSDPETAAPLPAAKAHPASLEVSQALRRARSALQRGQRAEARRWAEQAALLDPASEDAWLILAAIASPRASLEYLKRALESNPESTRARMGMHWAVQRLRAAPISQSPLPPDTVASTQPFSLPPAAPVFSTPQGRLVEETRPRLPEAPVAPPSGLGGPSPLGRPRLPRAVSSRDLVRHKVACLPWLALMLCLSVSFLAWMASPGVSSLRKLPAYKELVVQAGLLVASPTPTSVDPSSLEAALLTAQAAFTQAASASQTAVKPTSTTSEAAVPTAASLTESPEYSSAPSATPSPTPSPTLAASPSPSPLAATSPAPTPTHRPTKTPVPPTPRPKVAKTPKQVAVAGPGVRPAKIGPTDRWVDVDLSSQTAYALIGDQLQKSFLVSTGTWQHPTVTGLFHVYVKYRYADMVGEDYNLPNVPYVMYFYQDYGLHGTYWHNNFGHPMSHGCVNFRTDDAGWLFTWSSVGTPVNIHQ